MTTKRAGRPRGHKPKYLSIVTFKDGRVLAMTQKQYDAFHWDSEGRPRQEFTEVVKVEGALLMEVAP